MSGRAVTLKRSRISEDFIKSVLFAYKACHLSNLSSVITVPSKQKTSQSTGTRGCSSRYHPNSPETCDPGLYFPASGGGKLISGFVPVWVIFFQRSKLSSPPPQ